ncbi:LOW QUALITY PROTEIN: short-chain dehydrogenase/reductase SDR, partial [Streptomyces sp. AA4]
MQTEASVALVTGSSRGIGRAIAERLGADGLSVAVNYRSDQASAEAVVAKIRADGGQAVALRADVTDDTELRGLFDRTEKEFGGLDVVVANVGIARFVPLAEASDEVFDLIFNTNLRPTFVALREAARRVRDGGRIVVVSSGVVQTARPGTAIYGAAKAAGDQFVRVLAKELGPRRDGEQRASGRGPHRGASRRRAAGRGRVQRETDAARPDRRAWRHRGHRGVPGVGPGPLGHRPDGPRGRRPVL